MNFLRQVFQTLLQKAVVKAAFIALARILSGYGLGSWVAQQLATKLGKIADLVVKHRLNMMGYDYHVKEGKALVKRLKNAQTPDEYDSATDDIYS